jgi:hypothetical protein
MGLRLKIETFEQEMHLGLILLAAVLAKWLKLVKDLFNNPITVVYSQTQVVFKAPNFDLLAILYRTVSHDNNFLSQLNIAYT